MLPADSGPRCRPDDARDIDVLSPAAVIVVLGFGIVGPAILLLAADFGAGTTAAAMAVSAFALCLVDVFSRSAPC